MQNYNNVKYFIGNPDNNHTIKFSEHAEYQFDANQLIIPRLCDVMHIEYLEFDPVQKLNLSEFKKKYENAFLVIEANNNVILNLPFGFLMELKEPITNDNKIYLDLNFNMFLQDFIIVSYWYTQIKLTIINTNTDIDYNYVSIKLLTTHFYHEKIMRDQMVNNASMDLIQNVSIVKNTFIVKNGHLGKNDALEYKLLPNKIYKGFFIKIDDVDKIIKINLCVDNETIIDLNNFLIKEKLLKINDKMMYLSLCGDSLNYSSRSYVHLCNSIFTLNNNVVLSICLNDCTSIDIQLYELCIDGCMSLAGIFDKITISKNLAKKLYLDSFKHHTTLNLH